MKRMQEMAVLLELITALRENTSWCGETHIQKAAYFLKELLHVPLSHEFVLYRHGPFSFELRDTLGSLRADEMLRVLPQEPYGATLLPTEFGCEIRNRFPKTIAKYRNEINLVAQRLGPLDVSGLERLGTALYVTLETPDTSSAMRAARVRELKPHIPSDDAERAVRDVDDFRSAV